ncbi:MAG: GNAT family N-acetyltransferase [Spirochaetes bacterium]|nr:GNAT family N-acetyltransferase [Spirochaetota bacterium]
MDFLPYSENDIALLKAFFQNPEVMNLTPDDVYSDDGVSAYLGSILENNAAPDRRKYEYRVMEEGVSIGFADLEIVRRTPRGGIAEVGYLLLPQFWNRGLGTAVCRMLIETCFQSLHMHKVTASCHEENRRSIRVMEKCGMTLEGRLRKHRYKHGRFADELRYAVLKADFNELA